VAHLDNWCDGLASCGMVSPCKACPVPLTAPWDGGPAGSIDTKHPARLAPRFISGTGIVRTETKHPPSHPVPCPSHEKKKENRQVTWSDGAFQSFCAPNAGSFLRGDISWHRYFTCGYAVPLTPGRGGGPGTVFDTSTLPTRPPPPAARLLRLPKKRE
jgi:hypothetical protein